MNRSDGITVKMIKIIRHPKYTGRTSYFDVGIVETDHVTFTEGIRPICLPLEPSSDVRKYDRNSMDLLGKTLKPSAASLVNGYTTVNYGTSCYRPFSSQI